MSTAGTNPPPHDWPPGSESGRDKVDLVLHLLANLPRSLLLLAPTGSGKTTLLRKVQAHAHPNWTVCYVAATPNHSYERILEEILTLLQRTGQAIPERGVETALKARFSAMEQQGRVLVLLLDDAGALMPGLLSALCQLARGTAPLKLVFSLRPDELADKAVGDALALADAHVVTLPGRPSALPTSQEATPRDSLIRSTVLGEILRKGDSLGLLRRDERTDLTSAPGPDAQPGRPFKPLSWLLTGAALLMSAAVGMVAHSLWQGGTSTTAQPQSPPEPPRDNESRTDPAQPPTAVIPSETSLGPRPTQAEPAPPSALAAPQAQPTPEPPTAQATALPISPAPTDGPAPQGEPGAMAPPTSTTPMVESTAENKASAKKTTAGKRRKKHRH